MCGGGISTSMIAAASLSSLISIRPFFTMGLSGWSVRGLLSSQ